MSDSWDWMEQHKKKERQRKRFFIFCLFMSLPAMLITIPSMLRVPAPDSPPNNETELENAQTVGEPPVEKQTDQFVVSEEWAESFSAKQQALAEAESAELSSDSDPSISRPVSPTEPATPDVKREVKPDPMLPRAQRTLERLTRRLDQIGERRLNQHGGEPWASMASLKVAASDMSDPTSALVAAEEALRQVDGLAIHVDTEELLTATENAKPALLLSTFVEFLQQHPDGPRLPQIEDRIRRIPRETWLQMASDDLAEASPDDGGFAEGWMPIADAWLLVGKDVEARDAIRRAREALPRMTTPERILETTMELCQHAALDSAHFETLISKAVAASNQVSNAWVRSVHYANMAGLAKQRNHRQLSTSLLSRAIEQIQSDSAPTKQRMSYTQECRAAAWTETPETVFALCEKIEKLPYPEPVVNSHGYAHAAIAAARKNDRSQFLRAMFMAENALAPVRVYDHPNYLYAVRLADANILHRRWRAAVVIANNIPDPKICASILFRVMKDAPQEVYSPHLAELITRFADQQGAAPAVAGHAEHRLRTGEPLLDVVAWARQLPLASQRAAAYSGISRVAGGVPATPILTHPIADVRAEPDLKNAVSLIESAEQLADEIQDPVLSAFVWLRIAHASNLLGKTQRYREAVARVDDRLFDAWKNVWDARPPVKESINGGYIDSDDRHRKAEQETVNEIIECHRHLAEMQADLGDSRGAMESCLNWVNVAGFLSATATYNDVNFLRLRAIANRLQSETGVGSDAFPFLKHLSYRNTRALNAAFAHDIAGLKAAIPDLVANAQRQPASSSESAEPARANGELAILYAERGDMEAYRNARRSAQSDISSRRAPKSIQCVLATADAIAGEFALAESNLVPGTVRWFGDANRPRSQLAVSLANDGQWEKAIDQAKKISQQYPVYRSVAWTAIAKSRHSNQTIQPDELLTWVETLPSPVDKVAVFCGLALAVGSATQ